MYHLVTTLSEIADHTGLELLPQILMLKLHKPPKGLLNISYSTLRWPLVHCPSSILMLAFLDVIYPYCLHWFC